MPAPTTAAGAAAGAGPEAGGPPRTELQELQLKAGQTTDEVSFRIFLDFLLFKKFLLALLFFQIFLWGIYQGLDPQENNFQFVCSHNIEMIF